MPRDVEVNRLITDVLKPWQGGGAGIAREAWIERLERFSIEQLAEIAIGIQDYDSIVHPRRPHALEALRILVDAKLAAQTHDLMKKLDAATARLQGVGIAVGVFGVLVMLVQLLLAWLVARASGAV
jgi:hypothetical protein